MTQVVFNPTAFKARYPEFASVSNVLLGACFVEATLYLSNADNSPVQDVTRRTLMLNMLTAHIAYLGGALASDGQARPVGRVSQASEGSVSASFDFGTPGTEVWYSQSQYGAAFWQATLSLRRFRYIPQPTLYR